MGAKTPDGSTLLRADKIVTDMSVLVVNVHQCAFIFVNLCIFICICVEFPSMCICARYVGCILTKPEFYSLGEPSQMSASAVAPCVSALECTVCICAQCAFVPWCPDEY